MQTYYFKEKPEKHKIFFPCTKPFQLEIGKADVAMATITGGLFSGFDFGDPYWMTDVKFFTRLIRIYLVSFYLLPSMCNKLFFIFRAPRKVVSYGNITRPFSIPVWLLTIFTVSVLATMLFASHKVYNNKDIIEYGIMQKVSSQVDLFLYPFVKITEPDPMPWFDKWSTGRFLVFLWSLTAMILVMFYTSNLRAYMVMVDYEPEPRTLKDIVNRGDRVYIYNLAQRNL